MTILLIQENGRHGENRAFRECYTFERNFKKLGIDTIIWGLGHENFNEPIEKFIDLCDVIFIIENYPIGDWIPDLGNVKKLKIFWSIDSHCNLGAHIAIVERHKVDILLNAIESDQNKFNCHKKYYFPVAAISDLVYPMDEIEKTKFIGFCGTLFPERLHLIERIENKFGFEIPRDVWWLGNEMVKKINSYQINFNKTVGNDINFRVFETLSCKTMLLTNNTENITTFFTDMHDIVIYNDENELFEKIKFFIDNPNRITEIANNGYKNLIENHTYEIRTKFLLDIINSNI